jgi:hypothetical protein
MSDPFAKLVEAQKVYLNPILELIQKNLPLHEHCYYLLAKYPSNPANISVGFWTILEDCLEDLSKMDELIEYVSNGESSLVPLKEHLLSNLKMAKVKSDVTYLQYLFGKQPRKRTVLKIIRKNPMINPELATSIDINQSELNELTIVRLKMHLHRYIKNKGLQDDRQVNIDDNIASLLGLTDGQSKIHYFELLKLFNTKYLTSH